MKTDQAPVKDPTLNDGDPDRDGLTHIVCTACRLQRTDGKAISLCGKPVMLQPDDDEHWHEAADPEICVVCVDLWKTHPHNKK